MPNSLSPFATVLKTHVPFYVFLDKPPCEQLVTEGQLSISSVYLGCWILAIAILNKQENCT
jgi:hypothetical protein